MPGNRRPISRFQTRAGPGTNPKLPFLGSRDAHLEGQWLFATSQPLPGTFLFLWLTQWAGFHSHCSDSQPPGIFDLCGLPGFHQVQERGKPSARPRPGNQSCARTQGNHGALRWKDWVYPEDQQVSYWALLLSPLDCPENLAEIKTEGSRQHKGSASTGGN